MTVLELEDGTQINVVEAEIDDEFTKQRMCRVFVKRSNIDVDSFDRGETEAFLLADASDSVSNAQFGGVIKDRSASNALTEVMVESFERYSVDAKPSGAGERWQNVSDKSVVNDAISNVPQLSAGTVETVADDISIMFNHASQSYKVRQMQQISGAEIRYNADKTVDYVSQIGSSRSTDISPDNQNIKDDLNVKRLGDDSQTTHLRVIGAGEGKHQVQTEVSVDRPVTRQRWQVVSEKNINKQEALDEFANTLIDDLNEPDPVEVDVTVEALQPKLGDEFRVFYPEEDVDYQMRVVEHLEKYKPSGREDDLVLSTRRESRIDDESKMRNDIENFNQSLQGNASPINTSGGRQPVSSNHNYQMEFYYPSEVEFEHRLNVRVIGLPYRAYSQGADLGGGSIVQKDPIAKVFADNDGGSWSEQFDLPQFQNDSFGEIATVYVTIQYMAKSGVNSVSFGSGNAYIENVTTGTTLFEPDDPNTTRSYLQSEEETLIVSDSAAITDSIAGDTIEIRLEDISADTDAQWNLDYGAILEGAHRHPPLPGIIEGFGDPAEKTYPKECAVQVASPGGSVRSTLGIANSSGEDAAFRASFDARGEFQEGGINRVQITSTNTGHILAYIEGDVYRQITGDG